MSVASIVGMGGGGDTGDRREKIVPIYTLAVSTTLAVVHACSGTLMRSVIATMQSVQSVQSVESVQSVDDSVPLVCRTNGSAPVNWLCPAYPVLLNITLQIFYTNKHAIVDHEISIFWKRICEQKFLLPSNSVGLKIPTKRLSLCRRIIDYVYFTAQ